jgi:hypothetical protein
MKEGATHKITKLTAGKSAAAQEDKANHLSFRPQIVTPDPIRGGIQFVLPNEPKTCRVEVRLCRTKTDAKQSQSGHRNHEKTKRTCPTLSTGRASRRSPVSSDEDGLCLTKQTQICAIGEICGSDVFAKQSQISAFSIEYRGLPEKQTQFKPIYVAQSPSAVFFFTKQTQSGSSNHEKQNKPIFLNQCNLRNFMP